MPSSPIPNLMLDLPMTTFQLGPDSLHGALID